MNQSQYYKTIVIIMVGRENKNCNNKCLTGTIHNLTKTTTTTTTTTTKKKTKKKDSMHDMRDKVNALVLECWGPNRWY